MKGWAVLLLTLIATAFANPIADVNGDIFARGKKYPKGCRLTDYNCMLNYGGRPFVSTFCTSEVPITTVTKNRTTTETVTSFTGTVTEITATTVVEGSTVTTTAEFTDFVTVPGSTTVVSTTFTGSTTITTAVATVTSVETDTVTEFTCGGASPTPTPVPLPSPITEKMKRQAGASDTASQGTSTDSAAPAFTCFPDEGDDEKRQRHIRGACKCAQLPTPTSYSTVTATVTVSRLSTVYTTTETRIPTSTVSVQTIVTTTVPVSVTATDVFTSTESTTAQETTRTTVTVTSSQPTPSSFAIGYNSSGTVGVGRISPASDRPGSSGTLIVFDQTSGGSPFSLNAQSQLSSTENGQVLGKNTRDPFPYLFLDDANPEGMTPSCSICNSTLTCDFPGSSGSVFALCNGFLSLGSFGSSSTCQVIDLTILPLTGPPAPPR